jgi:hypothetical protein
MLPKKYQPLIIFFIALLAFSVLQFSFADFLGHDGYYHAKMALLIKESKGLVHNFPWMHYTIFNDNFAEHHLLYHLLLVPFIAFLPTILGIKIAAVLFASLAVTLFYWLLTKLKIKFPFFWTFILLFSSSFFLFRLNLPRAQSLSLIFIFLGIYALLKKKYFLLLLTTFFYSWLFDGFILLGLITFIYAAVDILFNLKRKEIKTLKNLLRASRPLVIFAAGLGISILANPYFPNNIHHLYFHLCKVGLLNPFSNLPVGGEWSYSSFSYLIQASPLILILFIASLSYLNAKIIVHKTKNINKEIYFFAAISIAFLILTILIKKLIEYSAPLIILLTAAAFDHFWKQNQNYLTKKLWPVKKNLSIAISTIAVIILISLGGYNFCHALKDITNYSKTHYFGFKEAADWLAKNTAPNSVIFHVDWGDFAPLFFYNSNNYYINGLDPNFMLEYDKNLFEKWNKIFHGKNLAEMHGTIKNDFGSDYIFITEKFKETKKYVDSNPMFKKVFEVEKGGIYRLK